MSPYGIATVARQEFTIRIRTGRQRWILGIWFLLLVILTALTERSLSKVALDQAAGKGVVIYGVLTLVVLGISLLIAPGLSAQSINGDRERGTLATIQVTRLTPGDIAVGKLLAAWGTAVVFLLLTVPLVGYAMAKGDVPLGRALVVTGVVVLLLGSVIAMALCVSSLVSRTSASGMLAYLIVFLLTVGTLMAYGIARSLQKEEVTQTLESTCPPAEFLDQMPAEERTQLLAQCQHPQTVTYTRTRGDKVWWLLAPNPYVILADAAPQLPPETEAQQARRRQLALEGKPNEDPRRSDPLGALGRSVRGLRLHPGQTYGGTGASVLDSNLPAPKVVGRKLVWPYGLAFDVLLGAGAVWLTTRRLKTPTRKLPKGQRVA